MKEYQITENNITYDIREFSDGSKYYLLNGEYHRENGPACEYCDGDKIWYKNGLPHRIDGPAYEYSGGACSWYKNGVCHRDDGPAIIFYNGDKEYWYNGKQLNKIKSDKEFKRYIKILSIS